MGKKITKKKNADGSMTVSGHLRELRNRLIVCILFLIVFFLIGMYFAPELVKILTGIGTAYGYEFIYISPPELLLQYFSVAFICGVILTLPVILYNVWAFIQPGLKKNENKLFIAALFSGLICFVIGVLFAYKLMLPFMLRFLIGISSGSEIHASVTVGNYLTFLMTIFIIFGIIFELPVLCVILTQMGLLKVAWMKKARKVVIILIFFIAAVVTPPDVVSQCMVAIPMLALYELSILLCTLIPRGRREEPEEEDEEEDGDDETDKDKED